MTTRRPDRPLVAGSDPFDPEHLPHRSGSGDTLRALCVAALVTVGVMVLGFVLEFWRIANPPTNSAAHRREAVLLEIPTIDPVALGITFVDEWSDPGAAASGFSADSPDPVVVRRTYLHLGDPMATCQAVTAALLANGWHPTEHSYPCEAFGDFGGAGAKVTRNCGGFEVSAWVVARSSVDAYDPDVVSIGLETRYPDTGEPRTVRDLDTTIPASPASAC